MCLVRAYHLFHLWFPRVYSRKGSEKRCLGDIATMFHWRILFSHVPGRQFLWIDPFQVLSVVLGSTFPWAGRIGHYSAKFSRKFLYLLIHIPINVSQSHPSIWEIRQYMLVGRPLVELPNLLLDCRCWRFEDRNKWSTYVPKRCWSCEYLDPCYIMISF